MAVPAKIKEAVVLEAAAEEERAVVAMVEVVAMAAEVAKVAVATTVAEAAEMAVEDKVQAQAQAQVAQAQVAQAQVAQAQVDRGLGEADGLISLKTRTNSDPNRHASFIRATESSCSSSQAALAAIRIASRGRRRQEAIST
jgi:hypothetical protein